MAESNQPPRLNRDAVRQTLRMLRNQLAKQGACFGPMTGQEIDELAEDLAVVLGCFNVPDGVQVLRRTLTTYWHAD
jgi:hypothetical protein